MIIQGNALNLPLKDGTVQCCVTSPPYYGLRDYGTAKWQGGDPNCDHNPQKPDGGVRADNTLPLGRGGIYKDICGKCGAIRIDDQIGLEPTPDEYVTKLVSVFREVKRVLKDDGVVFLNLGDSYAGSGNGSNDYREDGASLSKNNNKYGTHKPGMAGLKQKDLIGIPWMVAFALRADGAASPSTMLTVEKIRSSLLLDYGTWEEVPDKTRNTIEALDREWDDAHHGGWYLRSDIIWHKPNPMPESVKDRPTKAHEYVFLLAKSQRYYYDAEAIMEPHAGTAEKYESSRKTAQEQRSKHLGQWTGGKDTHFSNPMNPAGRNKRSVWTITTQPFKGAHFAVMPEKLVEPCVLAGTSEYGQCPKCGANWVRVTDHKVSESKTTNRINNDRNDAGRTQFINAKTETLGWQPTCDCNAGREPNIVLDPFAGSGTVGVVAQKHGRQFIGIELNPDYVKLAEARLIATPQSLFNQSVLQETP